MVKILRPEDCDPNDPDTAFAWVFQFMPIGNGESPVLMPDYMRKQFSRIAHGAGLVHDPERQYMKVQRPLRGQQTALNGLGRWVKIDEPEPDTVRLPNIDAMTVEENAAMIAQYEARGMIRQQRPAPKPARIETGEEQAKIAGAGNVAALSALPERMRVHELAKRIGVKSSVVLAQIAEDGTPRKSHNSIITREIAIRAYATLRARRKAT